MWKREYYCLVAGLPDLFLDETRLTGSSISLRDELRTKISPRDYELVRNLFYPSDNRNLINLLFPGGGAFENSGNFSKESLKQQLINTERLPAYMRKYISELHSIQGVKYSPEIENTLHGYFYDEMLNSSNPFTREWFGFNLNMKNIITSLNIRNKGAAHEQSLVRTRSFETVCRCLENQQYNHPVFEETVPFYEEIFNIAGSNHSLIEKERMLDNLKWEFLDDAVFFHPFTIEKILSFICKLMIIERWLRLDHETGRNLLMGWISKMQMDHDVIKYSVS